jgi:CRP-like cAMP-binding protein
MLIIERVSALNRSVLFTGVHDHALAEIAQIVTEIAVEDGEVIMREGAHERWMFLLVEGRACVDVGGTPVSTIGPGDSVGELALLDPAPRAATVTALEPCLLFRIDEASFREVMEEQPTVVMALLVMLTRMLRATPHASPVSG